MLVFLSCYANLTTLVQSKGEIRNEPACALHVQFHHSPVTGLQCGRSDTILGQGRQTRCISLTGGDVTRLHVTEDMEVTATS